MKYMVTSVVVVLCGLFMVLPSLEAQKKPVVRVFRQESDKFPIEVVSRDSTMNNWLQQQAEETVKDVLQLLDLDEVPFSKLSIRWRPGNAEGVFTFSRLLRQQDAMSEVEIDFTGANRSQAVAIRRTLVIAILQAYIWHGASEITAEVIPEPPLWLSEGLLWHSMGYAHEEWTQVVSKASRTGKVPKLSHIQGWEELSELKLERVWQQAFTYHLTRKTLQSRVEKEAVILWLKKFRQSKAVPFWDNDSQVESWWQEVASERMKKKIPIMDWDQSIAMLNQLRHFSLRLKGGERKLFFIEKLPEEVMLDPQDESITEHIQKFDLLALSSHYALHPAVNRYRNALKMWAENEHEEYAELVKEAREWEDWVVSKKQAATDTLDWAVVNLDVQHDDSNADLLNDYSKIVRELEGERLRARRELQEKIFQK